MLDRLLAILALVLCCIQLGRLSTYVFPLKFNQFVQWFMTSEEEEDNEDDD